MTVQNDEILVPSDKPRVTLYIDSDLKQALEVLAERADRSVSNYVIQLIRQDVARAQKSGELPGLSTAAFRQPGEERPTSSWIMGTHQHRHTKVAPAVLQTKQLLPSKPYLVVVDANWGNARWVNWVDSRND